MEVVEKTNKQKSRTKNSSKKCLMKLRDKKDGLQGPS